MRHKLCRSFHPWCPGVKNRCLSVCLAASSVHTLSQYFCRRSKNCLLSVHVNCKPGVVMMQTLSMNIWHRNHYNDVIMGAIASQITSFTIVYSIVYGDADQRKHQSSASLAFVRGIHRGPVNSPHKWPITRKMFPFDDVIMTLGFHNDNLPCRHRRPRRHHKDCHFQFSMNVKH